MKTPSGRVNGACCKKRHASAHAPFTATKGSAWGEPNSGLNTACGRANWVLSGRNGEAGPVRGPRSTLLDPWQRPRAAGRRRVAADRLSGRGVHWKRRPGGLLPRTVGLGGRAWARVHESKCVCSRASSYVTSCINTAVCTCCSSCCMSLIHALHFAGVWAQNYLVQRRRHR